MPAVRDLVTRWSLVVNNGALDKLNQGITAANKKLGETGKKATAIDKVTESIGRMANAFTVFATYEGAKRLFQTIEQYAQLGTEIKVVASSVGLTTEKFQELSYAASQSNISQEKVSTSLERFAHLLFEAKTGSQEALLTFSRLGISTGQIGSIHDAGDAMLLLADRVQRLSSWDEKLALIRKTLGRGSTEMVAFLSQGPAAIRAQMGMGQQQGLILSQKQIDALNRMYLALNKFGFKWKEIMATIFVPLEPLVEGLTDGFVKLYNANEKAFGPEIKKGALWLTKWIAFFAGYIDGFVTTIGKRIGGKKGGLFSLIFGDIAAVGGVVGAFFLISKSMGLILGLILRLLGLKGLIPLLTGAGEAAGAAGAAGAVGEGALGTEGALGAMEALATGGAGAGFLAMLTGTLLPLLAAGGAGVGLGVGIDKLMDSMTGGKFSSIVGAPGAWLAGLMQPSDQDALAKGAAIYQTNHTTIHAHGTDPQALASHIDKRINDHHNKLMQDTARQSKGPKVGG